MTRHSFTRPHIADVACPLLVGCIRREVTIQQVRHNVELVIAVRRHLVFAGSHH